MASSHRPRPEAKLVYDRQYHAEHRDAIKRRKAAWYQANHARISAQQKLRRAGQSWNRGSRYGLKKADVLRLEALHGGKCWACGVVPSKPLSIDHDHATGAVRGLLCNECNITLGFARDDPNRLRRLILYLFRASQLDSGEPSDEACPPSRGAANTPATTSVGNGAPRRLVPEVAQRAEHPLTGSGRGRSRVQIPASGQPADFQLMAAS